MESLFSCANSRGHVFTPKALNDKAQGQPRSGATLGYMRRKLYAKGVAPNVCNAFGVRPMLGLTTQAALREPGL
jgi:hypothetical protein